MAAVLKVSERRVGKGGLEVDEPMQRTSIQSRWLTVPRDPVPSSGP